jgi:hypothetical protein
MLDFDVGNAGLQNKLEWVAEPPPMLPSAPSGPNSTKVLDPRKTHALRFQLFDLTNTADFSRKQYEGLMFFRPKGTGHGPVGLTAGLDGIGYLEPTLRTCEALIDDIPGNFPPDFVKVFIGVRPRVSGPADIFATLQLLANVLPDVPAGQTVEFSHVNATEGGDIEMDVPEGWLLSLRMTTVLLRLP